jgi:hypothetical protein
MNLKVLLRRLEREESIILRDAVSIRKIAPLIKKNSKYFGGRPVGKNRYVIWKKTNKMRFKL